MNASSTSMLQKEDTSHHPLRNLTDQPKKKDKKFLQNARKGMEEKGSVGSFTREAKHSGEGVQERASENYNKPGAEGKKARFAYLAGHNWKGK